MNWLLILGWTACGLAILAVGAVILFIRSGADECDCEIDESQLEGDLRRELQDVFGPRGG